MTVIPIRIVRMREAAPILIVSADKAGRRRRFWLHDKARALDLLDRLMHNRQCPEIVRG